METPLEIDVIEAARLLRNSAQVILLDVRQPHELAICEVAGSRNIPMGEIPEKMSELPRDRHLLVLCHHGGRSLRVTQFLRANDYTQVSNVAGGIDAWAESVDPSLNRY